MPQVRFAQFVSSLEIVELLNRRELLYEHNNDNCLRGIDIVNIITRKHDTRKRFYNKEEIMISIEASREIDKTLKESVKKAVEEWLGFAGIAPPKKECIIL